MNRPSLFSGRSIAGMIAAAILLPLHAQAQPSPRPPTGVLAIDIRTALAEDTVAARHTLRLLASPDQSGSKSIWLAGGLSAVLPGAGQFYADAPLWRTLLYSTLEVASWTAYVVYNNKGDRAVEDFQNYADAHWDITRYISWIAENYQNWADGDVNKKAASEALAAIYHSNDPSTPGWQRVDIEQLHKLENAVTGGFSHTLPPHGDQQYYEQIGKYVQYRAGWDDHLREGDTLIYNPSRVSDRNQEYTEDRRQANELLGYAEMAVGVVIINHIVSMIDAAFAARSHNISLQAKLLRGEIAPDGVRRPAVGMEMRVGF